LSKAFFYFCCILFVFLTQTAQAYFAPIAIEMKRDTSLKSFVTRAKTYPQLDMIDVVRLVLHKRLMSHYDSVKPNKKLLISVLPAPGYTQRTGFLGVLSGNFAFFVSDLHSINQSNVTMNVSYTQKKQSIFVLQPNIWTKNDSWFIIGDNRFMKYPQVTYGLGGHSSIDSGYIMDYFLVRVHETLLKHIIKDFYAGFGYDFDDHFNIRELTERTNTDYQLYGGGTNSISSGFTINLLYDSRHNSINPQHGFYISVMYRYNSHDFGSTYTYNCLIGDFRTYIPLSKNKRHILALWSYNWFTFNGHAPYLDMPATGWDDYNNTGRGYIQSRFRGKNEVYFETEYRFPLVRDGILGGVVFANIESFTDYPSNKFTTAAPAWGCGLRIKLNKVSGSNISIDYGFGLHGSNGLVINIGELF
jgi:outer membrane protein assembly factor BamA